MNTNDDELRQEIRDVVLAAAVAAALAPDAAMANQIVDEAATKVVRLIQGRPPTRSAPRPS